MRLSMSAMMAVSESLLQMPALSGPHLDELVAAAGESGQLLAFGARRRLGRRLQAGAEFG
ncbi:hypothetical protein M1D80_14405 [Phyllobacteriaceae bacterium JZ32]